jgi:hypothetical protein
MAKGALRELPVVANDAGEWALSPTDVAQFIRLDQCQRYLRLRLHERAVNRHFLRDYGVAPQSIPPLLTRSGADFEERVEAAIRARFAARNFAIEPPRARSLLVRCWSSSRRGSRRRSPAGGCAVTSTSCACSAPPEARCTS